ncbi:hypothetical protein [Kocuria rhizosphaericola]|uniref:hypothetical protein n=1 Tax=Kocuria rhizosphaericola TaxID=3376284 RepID=UPI0037A1F4E2
MVDECAGHCTGRRQPLQHRSGRVRPPAADRTRRATPADAALLQGARRYRAYVLALHAAFVLDTALTGVGTALVTPTGADTTSLVLTPAAPVLRPGQEHLFTAVVVHEDGTAGAMTEPLDRDSTEDRVTLVDDSGPVTAVSSGETTITARTGKFRGTAPVVVIGGATDGPTDGPSNGPTDGPVVEGFIQGAVG